ncbi:MAG: glycoside hydrolase family 43 protein [Acidobacteriota bacterium]|nr:glycoside hydrolase family 43 protein [Acidobacteriota bacterium]
MHYENKFRTFILIIAVFLFSVPSFAQVSTGPNRKAPLYQNPIFDFDFPDPTLIRAADGNFYAYATQTNVYGGWINIQVARSADLVNWQLLGDALPTKPVWANQTQNFWAPHVQYADGKYFMYYSADPNSRTGLCMAVATADNPAGPFTDKGSPLLCGNGFVNIDPMTFDDPATGKRLIYWGSGFQPIKVQELAADRINFAPGSQAVNLIFPVSDPNPNSYRDLVEGAWVIFRNGFYYLFFSGDDCCTIAHYAVMVARSTSATGPFTILPENDGVIIRGNEKWLGPGHNSVIRDDRSADWIVYHAYHPENRARGRVMLINRLVYGSDGWVRAEAGAPTTETRLGPFIRGRSPNAVFNFISKD